MNLFARWLLTGVAMLIAAGASAAEDGKKKRGQLQANRAGWMLGMYVGEERGQPYPFVLEVAPKSEAKIKGIRAGDELIRLNDQETSPLKEAFERANRLRPGRYVDVWVRRGVQTIKVELRVPKTANAAEANAKDKDGDEEEKNGKEAGEGKKKKKKKKRGPVVIKPIPAENN